MERRLSIKPTPNIVVGHTNYRRPIIYPTDDVRMMETIKNFVSVLERNIKEDNLTLLRKNISTLDIEVKSNIKDYIEFLSERKSGAYDFIRNKLMTLPPQEDNFFSMFMGITKEEHDAIVCHELLHTASTLPGYYNGTNFSGFCQTSEDYSIGTAIDEGYTDLLLYRLFNIDRRYIVYKYESNITKNLELIAMRSRMIDLYFGADLLNLVGILERYSNITKTEKFIEEFDILSSIREDKDTLPGDIMYYHNHVSDFIVETYQRKLDYALKEGKINFSDYDRRFDKCLENLQRAFNQLGMQNKTLLRRR